MGEIAQRIAICQHPHGEGVWWDTAGHPHSGCIQDCDCTPVEYVRADPMRESRVARARGLAQAVAECRDDARLDGIRECAAEILQLLRE